MYIAGTLVDEFVRETEIILSDDREDGALDFFVCGDDGRPIERRMLSATAGNDSVAAVSYAGMTCHVTRDEIHCIDLAYP